jgi:hypothetical protein
MKIFMSVDDGAAGLSAAKAWPPIREMQNANIESDNDSFIAAP